jgi:pimeloyl-[acyl-carrier protein] methyl ester esterase
VSLYSDTCGKGPALVLLHGWGMHSGIWAVLMPALSGKFRVTCVDLPGHGRSNGLSGPWQLKATAEAVADIAPPDAAWLGWSLGGLVALAAAATGAAIDRMVLVATTPRFTTSPGWPCAMAPGVLAQFAASLTMDRGATLQQFLTLQARGDRQAGPVLRALRRTLAQHEPELAELRRGLEILAATDLRADMSSLVQPALVIAGERDHLVPLEAGRRLAACLPAGHFLPFAGAAHAPFLGQPAAFTAAVCEFLSGEEAAA